jgi:hypothetical protein
MPPRPIIGAQWHRDKDRKRVRHCDSIIAVDRWDEQVARCRWRQRHRHSRYATIVTVGRLRRKACALAPWNVGLGGPVPAIRSLRQLTAVSTSRPAAAHRNRSESSWPLARGIVKHPASNTDRSRRRSDRFLPPDCRNAARCAARADRCHHAWQSQCDPSDRAHPRVFERRVSQAGS